MAGRLTWQNVAAPDFSTALEAYATQGELFRQGAQDISGMFTGMDTRRKTAASTAAMNEAMKIQEVGAWDQAMQSGLLESLGIAPSQATPELMNYLAGQRDELSGYRADDLTHTRNQRQYEIEGIDKQRAKLGLTLDGLDAKRTQQLLDQAADTHERTKLGWGRDDIQYGRDEADFAEAEALELVKVQATELSDNLANSTSSKDEALRIIRDDETIPASTKDIILENINARPDEYWSVAPEHQGASTLAKPFQVFDEYQSGRQAQLINKHGGNMAVRTLLDGYERFEGAEDPGAALIESVTSDETFGESAGETRQLLNKLVAETGLPPEIVALVMEQNVRQKKFLGLTSLGPLGDDEQAFDRKAIKAALEPFANEETLGLLNSEAQSIKRDWAELDADAKARERLATQYELELSRGGDGSQAIAAFNDFRFGVLDRTTKPGQTLAPAGGGDTIPYQPSDQGLAIPGNLVAPVPPVGSPVGFDQILQAAAGQAPAPAQAPQPAAAPAQAPQAAQGREVVDPLMGAGMGWDDYIARMNGDTNPRQRPNGLAQQSDRINQGISDYDRAVEQTLRDAEARGPQTKFGPAAEAAKLVESSSLPGGVKAETTAALAALESGIGPNGQSLTPPEMEYYAARVAKVMEAIRSGGSSNSAVDRILNKVSEWLPF